MTTQHIPINNCINNKAYREALKSDSNFRLGAVITKGRSKIICSSHNTSKRSSYLKNISNCMHAEMAVATKFIHTQVRPNHIKVSCASV